MVINTVVLKNTLKPHPHCGAAGLNGFDYIHCSCAEVGLELWCEWL